MAAREPQRLHDVEIDPSIRTSHSAVMELCGANKRVLDLGCATGYLGRALEERGCEVHGVDIDPEAASIAADACTRAMVADIESPELDDLLSDERFDVLVAADVLEHLRDPAATLRRLRGRLEPGGYLLATVPNVTHGSVRLALLQGRFPYAPQGLLARDHLRFFSRAGIFELFEDGGWWVAHLHALSKPLSDSEVPFDPDAVPEGVHEMLAGDEDAETYQFVVVARPVEPGLPDAVARGVHELTDEVRARRREVADEARARRREVADLNARIQELERVLATEAGRVSELAAGLAAATTREEELRALLVEAHSYLAERDDEIERLEVELAWRRAVPDDREVLRQQVERMRGTRVWRLACAYWGMRERIATTRGR
jgi:2-polyprenyl-3-methyl-5-hydroxy-6-metoxy-1,4-benzoquinol methylase